MKYNYKTDENCIWFSNITNIFTTANILVKSQYSIKAKLNREEMTFKILDKISKLTKLFCELSLQHRMRHLKYTLYTKSFENN